jgi:flagellar biogenesis protein FliO
MNKPQKVRIETPIGTIESDSGNHLVDIGTVLGFVVFLYLIRKLMKKFMF